MTISVLVLSNEPAKTLTNFSLMSGGSIAVIFPILINSSQMYPVVSMQLNRTDVSVWVKLLNRMSTRLFQLLRGSSMAAMCEIKDEAACRTMRTELPKLARAMDLMCSRASTDNLSKLSWF